jgi:hypothetical protein
VQRLATTDPRSDLLNAQLEVTATVTRFVFLSHSLPDPDAVDGAVSGSSTAQLHQQLGVADGRIWFVFLSTTLPNLAQQDLQQHRHADADSIYRTHNFDRSVLYNDC